VRPDQEQPASPSATPSEHRPGELRRARFEAAAIRYHTLKFTIALAPVLIILGVIVAIPTMGIGLVLLLVPVAAFFAARAYYRVYFDKLECTLTERHLFVGRGILFRQEKAIPLDRITDMSMNQGPLLRYLDLEAMGVETAGQSGGASGGALVRLVGIAGSREFRAAVLEQRDRVSSHQAAPHEGGSGEPAPGDSRTVELLTEIRDGLARIEDGLNRAGREP